MNMTRLAAMAALGLSLAAGGAIAEEKAKDKASQQAEIRKVAQETLQEAYKLDKSLKAKVESAPGYAVFSTFGLSFIIGGAGGKGLVHDNKSKQDTFMDLAQASAGAQIGGGKSRTLIVFKTEAGMKSFVEKGWEFGGGGGAAAAGGDKEASSTIAGENVVNDALYYTITKKGVHAGGAVAGTKVWKDKELN